MRLLVQRRQRRRRAKKPKRPYVVLLVMDEFPGDSLLDRHRRIDPVRYPNFAALAGDATWFRNAYSVYDSTTKAVPLILDGIRPHPGTAADGATTRTRSTTFARHGYRIVDSEEATALCPPSICPARARAGRRSSRTCWAAAPQRFDRWVRTIKRPAADALGQARAAAARPLHLPARRAHADAARGPDLLPGMNTVPGFHDEFLTRHNEQRYLLQLGFTDRLLGRLLEQLKRRASTTTR